MFCLKSTLLAAQEAKARAAIVAASREQEIVALREAKKVLEAQVADLNDRLDKAEGERKKAIDKMLTVSGWGAMYEQPAPLPVDKVEPEPSANNIRDFCSIAEMELAKERKRREAQERVEAMQEIAAPAAEG